MPSLPLIDRVRIRCCLLPFRSFCLHFLRAYRQGRLCGDFRLVQFQTNQTKKEGTKNNQTTLNGLFSSKRYAWCDDDGNGAAAIPRVRASLFLPLSLLYRVLQIESKHQIDQNMGSNRRPQ